GGQRALVGREGVRGRRGDVGVAPVGAGVGGDAGTRLERVGGEQHAQFGNRLVRRLAAVGIVTGGGREYVSRRRGVVDVVIAAVVGDEESIGQRLRLAAFVDTDADAVIVAWGERRRDRPHEAAGVRHVAGE